MRKLMTAALTILVIGTQCLPSLAKDYELNIPINEIKVTSVDFEDITLIVFADGTVANANGTVDFHILSDEQNSLVALHQEKDDVLVLINTADTEKKGLYWIAKNDIIYTADNSLEYVFNSNLYGFFDDNVHSLSYGEELSYAQQIPLKPDGKYLLATIDSSLQDDINIVWLASYYIKELDLSQAQDANKENAAKEIETPILITTQQPEQNEMENKTEEVFGDLLMLRILIVELFILISIAIIALILTIKMTHRSVKKTETHEDGQTIQKTDTQADISNDNKEKILEVLKSTNSLLARLEKSIDIGVMALEKTSDRQIGTIPIEKIPIKHEITETEKQKIADDKLKEVFEVVFKTYLEPNAWKKGFNDKGYNVKWLKCEKSYSGSEHYTPDTGSGGEIAAVSKDDYIYVVPSNNIICPSEKDFYESSKGPTMKYWYNGEPTSKSSLYLIIPALAKIENNAYTLLRKGELG